MVISYPWSFCTHGCFITTVVSYPWLFCTHNHFVPILVVSYPCMVISYLQLFCTHNHFVPILVVSYPCMHGHFISTVVLYPWLFCIQSFHTQIQSICTQFEPVCTQMAGSFLPVPIYIHSKYLTYKHMNTC